MKIFKAILIIIGILWVIYVMGCGYYRESREVILDRDKASFIAAWKKSRVGQPYDYIIDTCLNSGCDPRYCGQINNRPRDGSEPDYTIRFK